MSDVVAAALIAAGVGVVGTIATATVAVMTTARQTRADAERLRDEHREADRRVRRDAYAQLLFSLERLDMLTSAYTAEPTLDAFEDWLASFRAAGVAVRLVQSPAVGAARAEVGSVLNELTDEVMRNTDHGMPMVDALSVPYVQMRARLNVAGRALGTAMGDDLAFAAD